MGMNSMSKHVSWSLVVLGMMTSSLHAQRAVILVRHAEKEAGTGDVPLSSVGKKRAEALVRAMKDADIEAIYTTTWSRTKQTAEPLAKSLNLTPKIADVREPPAAFALRLQREFAEQTVLIVGHSDTVPALIDAIAKRKVGVTIGVGEFDNIFILLPKRDGSWSVVRARY
jgi:broad specificity phosphatase PhoE